MHREDEKLWDWSSVWAGMIHSGNSGTWECPLPESEYRWRRWKGPLSTLGLTGMWRFRRGRARKKPGKSGAREEVEDGGGMEVGSSRRLGQTRTRGGMDAPGR